MYKNLQVKITDYTFYSCLCYMYLFPRNPRSDWNTHISLGLCLFKLLVTESSNSESQQLRSSIERTLSLYPSRFKVGFKGLFLWVISDIMRYGVLIVSRGMPPPEIPVEMENCQTMIMSRDITIHMNCSEMEIVP